MPTGIFAKNAAKPIKKFNHFHFCGKFSRITRENRAFQAALTDSGMSVATL
jgi:hypothetical protein